MALLLISAGTARAQVLGGYMVLEADSIRTRTEDENGRASRITSNVLIERFDVRYTERPWPNLRILAGGNFEHSASVTDSEQGTVRPSFTRLRPQLRAQLRTSQASLEAGYDRNQETQTVEGARSNPTVRELLFTTLGWYPVSLPQVTLRLLRGESFDRARRFLDQTSDIRELRSQWTPIRQLRLYYRGSHEDIVEHRQDMASMTSSQTGRANFSDTWLRGHLSVYGDYNLSRRATEGGALAEIPQVGLSGTTDTPDLVTLAVNPALVDDNLTESAGINLGLPPAGGDDRGRNLGVGFIDDTEVNLLFVWIDRDITRPEVRDAFAWRVYVSVDGNLWSTHAMGSARFDPDRLRYEIRFPNVTTRYLKVVTRPLSPAVSYASEYPEILVTEMQAALEGAGRREQTLHTLSAGSRTRILGRPQLTHELTYGLSKPDDREGIYTLTNGLSASHQLGPSYAVAARASREDRQDKGLRLVGYVFTGSLSASPVRALRHTLVVSRRNREQVEGDSADRSVVLSTSATVMRGAELIFGLSRGHTMLPEFGEVESQQYNLDAVLVPHPAWTVSLSYLDQHSSRQADVVQSQTTRAGELSATYRPVPSLYLTGSRRVENREGQEQRSLSNYGVTWTPFAQGTLHVGFRYDESYQSEPASKQRTLVPSLRWDITARSWLDLSYQRTTSDAGRSSYLNEVLSAALRLGL